LSPALFLNRFLNRSNGLQIVWADMIASSSNPIERSFEIAAKSVVAKSEA